MGGGDGSVRTPIQIYNTGGGMNIYHDTINTGQVHAVGNRKREKKRPTPGSRRGGDYVDQVLVASWSGALLPCLPSLSFFLQQPRFPYFPPTPCFPLGITHPVRVVVRALFLPPIRATWP